MHLSLCLYIYIYIYIVCERLLFCMLFEGGNEMLYLKSFMSAWYDAFVIFFFGTLNTIILKTLLTCSLFNYSIYNLVWFLLKHWSKYFFNPCNIEVWRDDIPPQNWREKYFKTYIIKNRGNFTPFPWVWGDDTPPQTWKEKTLPLFTSVWSNFVKLILKMLCTNSSFA